MAGAGGKYSSASHVVFVYVCIITTFFKLGIVAASKPLGFSVRLIPMESHHNLTQFERIERLVHFSRVKAESFRLHFTNSNATFDDGKFLVPIRNQPFGYYNYYYYGEFQIGDPPQTVYLAIDTGSGLIWTQCWPGIRFFQQQPRMFDFQTSSTYQKIPCEHPACNYEDQHSPFDCVMGECMYTQRYGADGIGPTTGYLSLDSFTFRSSTEDDSEEYNIYFGCSIDNPNFPNFDYPQNRISGILGLSLDPKSLFSQLADLTDSIFSICIPPYRYYTQPHVLRFGDDVAVPAGNIPTTPYFHFIGEYVFYVSCSDISIGGYRLGFAPGTFDPGNNRGLFLDTGAPITSLTTQAMTGENVYWRVMSALMMYYNSYGLQRTPEHLNPDGLDLCYWNPPHFTNYASMTYHLQGADYEVDGRYMNMEFQNGQIFCVAMRSNPGLSILAANHMQNVRIIHDGNSNVIQFYTDDCEQDHL